jgi:hypothetical protein
VTIPIVTGFSRWVRAPLTVFGLTARADVGISPHPILSSKESVMWRLAALALLLCAGCGASSDFYQKDTRSWFATPPPSLGPTGDAQK